MGVGADPRRYREVWVLTRPWANRHEELVAALQAAPERDHLHIVEVPMPGPWRDKAWEPFQAPGRLEYVVWQVAAIRTARRIAQREHVDLAWHVTFANVWMGAIVDRIGPPSILGPVGGGVGPVWRVLPTMGLRGVVSETARVAARTFGRWFNPLARSAWTNADLILAQNRETASWLPGSTRDRTAVFHTSPSTTSSSDTEGATRRRRGQRRAIRRQADPMEGRAPRDRDHRPPPRLAAAGPGRRP